MKVFENLYFPVRNVFSVSKLIWWYLNVSFIDLATRFQIKIYLLNRKNVANAFPRSTYIMQALNKLPTDRRHIKVPHDRLLCHTHVYNKNKQNFQKNIFKCDTRPDLIGVLMCGHPIKLSSLAKFLLIVYNCL